MKFLAILTLVLASIGFNSSHAIATCGQENLKNHGPYVGIMSGVNYYNLKHTRTSPGYYFGGIAGYKFSNNIRAEIEASYQRFHAKRVLTGTSRNAHSWSCMANYLFDFDPDFPVKPYFGCGIGYTQIIANYKYQMFTFLPHTAKLTYKIQGFACQAIIGLKYVICKGWETSLDYRYCEIGKHFTQNKVGLTLARYY